VCSSARGCVLCAAVCARKVAFGSSVRRSCSACGCDVRLSGSAAVNDKRYGSVRQWARLCCAVVRVAVCGSVQLCAWQSAAVGGSVNGKVWQCARMCAAVRGCVRQYTWQCAAVHLGVCGSACGSVRLLGRACGSVRQCATVRADVCGCVRQCARGRVLTEVVCGCPAVRAAMMCGCLAVRQYAAVGAAVLCRSALGGVLQCKRQCAQ
jgi:hypothetical protein